MRVNKLIGLIGATVFILLLFSGCACEHEYGEWTVISPSSCTVAGTEERLCNQCEKKETRAIEVLPHSFGEWSVTTSPTCVELGEENRSCSVCGNIESKDIPMLTEHIYDEWKISKEPTCTDAGIKERKCIYCDEVGSESLQANGHLWIDATCTEPKTCEICKVTEGTVLAHKWNAATCTTAKKCITCGVTEGQPLAHDWKAATCTSAKTCKLCKKAEGNPLSHSINSKGLCKYCNKKMTAEDFTYLAWSDFKYIQSYYSSAKGASAYVIMFTDLNGDLCVLTYIMYRIIKVYDFTTLHNLTDGTVIRDPADYYSDTADRYYGSSRLHYLDLYGEILQQELEAMKGIADVLKTGKHSGKGAYVDAETLNY